MNLESHEEIIPSQVSTSHISNKPSYNIVITNMSLMMVYSYTQERDLYHQVQLD